jgi:hypothetical protein
MTELEESKNKSTPVPSFAASGEEVGSNKREWAAGKGVRVLLVSD